jgi:hypothetical protein
MSVLCLLLYKVHPGYHPTLLLVAVLISFALCFLVAGCHLAQALLLWLQRGPGGPHPSRA